MSFHDYCIPDVEQKYLDGLITRDEALDSLITLGHSDPDGNMAELDFMKQQPQLFRDVEAAYLHGSLTREGAIDSLREFGHFNPEDFIEELDLEAAQ